MSTQRVLIVGAGALGLTSAYHLQLAGADISFLVRPHRMEALSRPQTLFSYPDHTLRTLDDYRLLADQDLPGERFDFVLLTLDGATCRSEQGVTTLRTLGEAMADTGATMIICGVGIGLYEHVQMTTHFDPEHLLQGTMKMFAYQVGGTDTPQPPTAHLKLHDTADIAYLNFPDRVGFMVSSKPKAASKAFTDLYSRCGVAICRQVPASIFTIIPNIFFPFTIACEINGWQGTDALLADSELWRLCCRSQREVMRLKRHGLVGKLLSMLMRDARLAKMMRGMDRDASAMGFTAFNRFHHGAKVLAQDVQILDNCVIAGQAYGSEMIATRTLLEQWRKLHQDQQAQDAI